MRGVIVAVVAGLLLGLGAPVAAQVASRMYGTTSGGTIVQVLVDSTGKLVVWGE